MSDRIGILFIVSACHIPALLFSNLNALTKSGPKGHFCYVRMYINTLGPFESPLVHIVAGVNGCVSGRAWHVN